MGTRNLTAVYFDKDYRIAQYGQWDGYPKGQGMTALIFARKIVSDKEAMERFKANLKKSEFVDETYMRDLEEKWSKNPDTPLESKHAAFSRSVCADVLEMVLEAPRMLNNQIVFAADSLFCEYAYVIDLDKNTFEAYIGFNTTMPLTSADRFYPYSEYERDSYDGTHYYGIKLVKEWSLEDLPTDEEFYAAFRRDES